MPRISGYEPSGDACPYLMERSHWRVTGVQDLPRFFRAAGRVFPAGSILCVAGGAWPSEIQKLLQRISVDRRKIRHPGRGCEARESYHVPLVRGSWHELGNAAESYAAPEIGMHFVVFSGAIILLEWFDAPDDPISIAPVVSKEVVRRFSEQSGGAYEWIPKNSGNPDPEQ